MALKRILLTIYTRKGEIHVIRKSTKAICRFPQISRGWRNSWWKNVTFDQDCFGHGFWMLSLNGTPPWRGQGKRNFRWWNWSGTVARNDVFRRQSHDASWWCNRIENSVHKVFQGQIKPKLQRVRRYCDKRFLPWGIRNYSLKICMIGKRNHLSEACTTAIEQKSDHPKIFCVLQTYLKKEQSVDQEWLSQRTGLFKKLGSLTYTEISWSSYHCYRSQTQSNWQHKRIIQLKSCCWDLYYSANEQHLLNPFDKGINKCIWIH